MPIFDPEYKHTGLDRIGNIEQYLVNANGGSRPAATSVVIFGDSITNRINLNSTATIKSHDTRGYWTWASAFLGGKLALVKNAGVDGDRTDNMLARIATDVLAYAPGWVVVQCGINDVSQSISAAAIIANLTAIYSTLKGAGAVVVATTITPDNALTTPQNLVRGQVNEWMRAYAATTPGIVLCDWCPSIENLGSGSWVSGYSPDGVHPNATSAARMGLKLANCIAPLLATAAPLGLPTGNADPTNAVTNSFFSAGTIAQWTYSGDDAHTQIARTDEVQGQWSQSTTNTAKEAFIRATQATPANYFTAGTDYVYAVAEMQSDAWTSATDMHLRVVFLDAGSATIIQARDFWNSTGDTYPLENQPGLSGTVVLRTPAVQVPANTASIYVQGDFTGQGVIRWGRVAVRKIVAPMTALG